MDQKCTNNTTFSTRLGWKRGWKSCMADSKDWRSENVNAIKLNCKIVKKFATPLHFCINPPPPFSGLSPLSTKKFRIPPSSDTIFGRSYPPPFNKGGGVVWFQLCQWVGGGMLNRQNLLNVTKVVCQWTLKGHFWQWIDIQWIYRFRIGRGIYTIRG